MVEDPLSRRGLSSTFGRDTGPRYTCVQMVHIRRLPVTTQHLVDGQVGILRTVLHTVPGCIIVVVHTLKEGGVYERVEKVKAGRPPKLLRRAR